MTARESPGAEASWHVTRRCVMALAAGCATSAHAAPAIVKASKKVAGYVEKSDESAQNCAQCHFYLAPFDCMIVEGPVSPWGYCNYFAD